MKKVKLGPQSILYPKPICLIGANVDGKPNFMAAGFCGIVNKEPPMISVGIRRKRYTYRGVKQNGTFSVNVPSTGLVAETDYCGIASGVKHDKIKACKFNVFYGELKTAPLIQEVPVGLECSVLHELHLGTHALFVGRIEETYVSEDCLVDGEPDIDKIQPIVYIRSHKRAGKKTYHAVGPPVGRALNIGLQIKKAK